MYCIFNIYLRKELIFQASHKNFIFWKNMGTKIGELKKSENIRILKQARCMKNI